MEDIGTEADWVASERPDYMMHYLRTAENEQLKRVWRNNRRKPQLFAVACCRHLPEQLLDDRMKSAVALAERRAESGRARRQLADEASKIGEELRSRREAIEDDHRRRTGGKDGSKGALYFALEAVEECLHFDPENDENWWGICAVFAAISGPDGTPEEETAFWREARTAAHLLRDICGNPFRPVVPDARWLTATVADLARAIYADRAFERLPILADALMDAGCDNEDILGHCRSEGPHVRGCWVVDLVLGKA